MEFPEQIIHRIQHFLTGREAAASTILSKSWYSAWLTLPDISFDEFEYRFSVPLPELVNKTIQRYKESNLKIESFTLRMSFLAAYDPNNLIVEALKIGATHLNLHLLPRVLGDSLVLPNEVFAAENLIQLEVHGFLIDLGPDPNVRCSKLESLSLSVVGYEYYCQQAPGQALGILSLAVTFCRINFPKLHHIRCLVLSCSEFDIFYLGDLSSKFPFLQDLTLNYSGKFLEDIRVSSRSLERLKFNAGSPTMRVEFDVPNIRKFTFEGPPIESLSFKPVSREWESHLNITCHDGLLSTLWFLELSKLAAQFSQSKLHLYCRVYAVQGFDYDVEMLQCLPKLQVENLFICTLGVPSSNCFALFDGFFRICQPKFITQHLFPTTIIGWETNNTFLCKTLAQHIDEKCSVKSLGMHSLHDLKQVNLYVYDGVTAAWRDIPLKSLLHASASPKEKQTIHFRLEWRA